MFTFTAACTTRELCQKKKKKKTSKETSASKDRWQCLADRQMAPIVDCGHPKSDVYHNDVGMLQLPNSSLQESGKDASQLLSK